jgi:hypothetical protein
VDLCIVSSDEKVFDFPKAEITSEEKARRAMAEAKRLASLTPGEWRLWIDRTAERLGVPRAALEGLISATIKDSERKAREDKAELDAKKSVFGASRSASNASENANSRESTRRPNAKARKNRKHSSA